MYDKIKGYYDSGLWDINRVCNVVGKAITPEEYQQITGYVYPSKELPTAMSPSESIAT